MSQNDLPRDPLAAVHDLFGECLLIGAHARDHIVNVRAGLSNSRRTSDVDFAVAVPSLEQFREATAGLQPTSDTGMRFRIQEIAVDLVPFNPEGTDEPVIEVSPGIQMDVTGLDEAYATAQPLPGFQNLLVPTLPAMLVLKAVAWRIRGAATSKDATDLALLLKCLDEGEFADDWWSADDETMDRYDYDPGVISAFLTGKAAARDLPKGSASILSIWRDERLLVATGAQRVLRETYSRQLQALADGAALELQ